VLPDHKPWLVVQGRPGEFYIEHCHPFGLVSSSSNSGMIGNAVVDIWTMEGVGPVCKYEDDLKVFRVPAHGAQFHEGIYSYPYDRDECIRRISELGVPWHPTKGDLYFLFITDYIGFRWDIPRRLVSLPPPKRLKFLERVRVFLDRFSGHRCHLNDIESLHGSLCHVAFVYLDGRSHLPSLSNFAASFQNDEYAMRYPPPSVISDLQFWYKVLQDAEVSRPLIPRGEIQDLGIYVDACTSWGIGIVIDGSWAAFQLKDDWKIPNHDICWLETVAVELLVYFLEQLGFQNAHLRIYSDNKGTIGLLPKVEAEIAPLISLFAVLWVFSTRFSFLLILPTFRLQKIWLTRSRVGILGLLIKFCFLNSCSLTSSNLSSSMSSLNPSFSAATRAVASLVEEGHENTFSTPHQCS
jgi:hypothetical protein